jgi:uncharacterized protein (TIGR03435 family)
VGYDLAGYEIAGGPEWFNSQQLRSDIEAKIDGSASPGQIRLMVQSLLADRFQLKVHREMRRLPIYALAVARNGPKLKLASELRPGEHGGYVILSGVIQARSSGAPDLAKGLSVKWSTGPPFCMRRVLPACYSSLGSTHAKGLWRSWERASMAWKRS